MKKFLVIVGALGMFAGRAAAWEIKDNPDRFISVGVYTGIESASGSHSNLVNPGPDEVLQMESASSSTRLDGFDVRVPMFKQCTFTASYDQFTANREGVRTGNTYQTHDDLHGSTVKFGFRLYLAN